MDMSGTEQIFTSSHLGPEAEDFCQWKGFHLAPEKELNIQSILYWFGIFPGCGRYFIK